MNKWCSFQHQPDPQQRIPAKGFDMISTLFILISSYTCTYCARHTHSKPMAKYEAGAPKGVSTRVSARHIVLDLYFNQMVSDMFITMVFSTCPWCVALLCIALRSRQYSENPISSKLFLLNRHLRSQGSDTVSPYSELVSGGKNHNY